MAAPVSTAHPKYRGIAPPYSPRTMRHLPPQTPLMPYTHSQIEQRALLDRTKSARYWMSAVNDHIIAAYPELSQRPASGLSHDSHTDALLKIAFDNGLDDQQKAAKVRTYLHNRQVRYIEYYDNQLMVRRAKINARNKRREAHRDVDEEGNRRSHKRKLAHPTNPDQFHLELAAAARAQAAAAAAAPPAIPPAAPAAAASSAPGAASGGASAPQ